MRPNHGVTRCPKDCANRKPGCHNVETCENWRKQVEENRARLLEGKKRNESKRLTWEQRGLRM